MAKTNKPCLVCGSTVQLQLDIGPQPIANRFSASNEGNDFLHPFELGMCEKCALVQLMHEPPYSELRPRVSWVKYNEPESHVQKWASYLGEKFKETPRLRVCGVTEKDRSLVEAIAQVSHAETKILTLLDDLHFTDAHAGVESLPIALTRKSAQRVKEESGQFDLLVIRQTVEHVYELYNFFESLEILLAEDGYLYIEVPDCKRNFEAGDYTTLWEEHVCYFTPETFKNTIQEFGLEIVEFKIEPFQLEDSLIIIARKNSCSENCNIQNGTIDQERERLLQYVRRFSLFRDSLQQYLHQFVGQGKKIAVYGASHPACSFVNYFQIAECVDCIVDDNEEKWNHYLAGSKIQIHDSSRLLERDISLCILALNPALDDRVVAKHRDFINAGGVFVSAYPGSAYSLPVLKNYSEL